MFWVGVVCLYYVGGDVFVEVGFEVVDFLCDELM